MPLPDPIRRQLIDALARFRKEAMRGEIATIKQLADAYRKIYTRLQNDLELEARRIFEKPESAVSRQYIQARMKGLAEEIEKELERYQVILSSTIDTSTDGALSLGSKHAVELMKTATLGQAAIKGINFGALNPEQINTMIGFLAPGSPLFRRIDQLAKYNAPIIRDQLVEAIARGYGPYKAAGNIAPYLKQIAEEFQLTMARPFADAVRLTRTSMLWSYREAARANYQVNGDIITGWQWYASLDDLTCMSCVSMHGTVHPLDEPLDDHHHGRCTAVPVILGNTLVSEDAGTSWFEGLPADQQKSMMGPGAYNAWQSGQISLSQLSHQVEDDVYGVLRTVTPLKELLPE